MVAIHCRRRRSDMLPIPYYTPRANFAHLIAQITAQVFYHWVMGYHCMHPNYFNVFDHDNSSVLILNPWRFI